MIPEGGVPKLGEAEEAPEDPQSQSDALGVAHGLEDVVAQVFEDLNPLTTIHDLIQKTK